MIIDVDSVLVDIVNHYQVFQNYQTCSQQLRHAH